MFDNESSIYCFSYHTECKYTADQGDTSNGLMRTSIIEAIHRRGLLYHYLAIIMYIFYNIFNDIFLNAQ